MTQLRFFLPPMPQLGMKLTSVQFYLFWGTLNQGAIPTELPQPRHKNNKWKQKRIADTTKGCTKSDPIEKKENIDPIDVVLDQSKLRKKLLKKKKAPVLLRVPQNRFLSRKANFNSTNYSLAAAPWPFPDVALSLIIEKPIRPVDLNLPDKWISEKNIDGV